MPRFVRAAPLTVADEAGIMCIYLREGFCAPCEGAAVPMGARPCVALALHVSARVVFACPGAGRPAGVGPWLVRSISPYFHIHKGGPSPCLRK